MGIFLSRNNWLKRFSFRIWKTWEERIFYIFLFITTYGMLYLVLFLGPEISEWVNTLKSKMELNSTEENLLGFGVLILALFNLFYVFRMAWKNISEG